MFGQLKFLILSKGVGPSVKNQKPFLEDFTPGVSLSLINFF